MRLISGHRRLRILRRNRKLLHLKLPVEIADGILKAIFKRDGDVKRNVKLDVSSGIDGSEVNPVRKLCRLIGRRRKQIRITVLPDCQHQSGEKFLRAFLCAERAHIHLDLDIFRDIIIDCDLLRQGVAGHDVFEIRKQVGRRILTAGCKDKILCIAVIGHRAVCKSRQRAGQKHDCQKQQGKGFSYHVFHSPVTPAFVIVPLSSSTTCHFPCTTAAGED